MTDEKKVIPQPRDFGAALSAMQEGHEVQRIVWCHTTRIGIERSNANNPGDMEKDFIYIKKDNKKYPYTIESTDLLENDWLIYVNVGK